MKTEKEIIDDLGNWLCTDMEKAVHRNSRHDGPISTNQMAMLDLISDVAERIKFYRDNVLNH